MSFTRVVIADIVENISNVKQQRTLVNQSIQIALDRVFEHHDWPYYIQDKGVIETTAEYSTGTVTVTNGSKTVTGDGTTFTTAMVGRKFRSNDKNPFYRIGAFVSTTEITLEENYQGDDASDVGFNIYKDEYRLKSDVDKYKIVRQARNNVALFSLHPSRFDEVFPMPRNSSDPVYEIMEGTLLDTYSTGTVTLTGTTITGTTTAWTSVEGLGRLSNIRIGNNVYHVKTVDSDTQITTFETVIAVAAASSYEITLNNLRVQVHQIPDSQRLLYYRYFRIPDPLANDFDLPDMPHAFHWLLIYGSLSMVLMQKGDINKAQREAETRFLNGLENMKLKIGSFTPDRIYRRESVDRIRTRRGFNDGIESSNFDIRYSRP